MSYTYNLSNQNKKNQDKMHRSNEETASSMAHRNPLPVIINLLPDQSKNYTITRVYYYYTRYSLIVLGLNKSLATPSSFHLYMEMLDLK